MTAIGNIPHLWGEWVSENRPQIKIDATINLPLLITILAAVAAASMWVSSVNDHLGNLTKSVAEFSREEERINGIDRKLDELNLMVSSDADRIKMLEQNRH